MTKQICGYLGTQQDHRGASEHVFFCDQFPFRKFQIPHLEIIRRDTKKLRRSLLAAKGYCCITLQRRCHRLNGWRGKSIAKSSSVTNGQWFRIADIIGLVASENEQKVCPDPA